ncbi:MAG: hypothetical protein IK083_03165 [Abditibacteriota bacterium]|nr:hypothetical protein [Abditibacteriota bacterium]
MKTRYSFYSADGVLRKNFSREETLRWYYDGKIRKDAALTRTEGKQRTTVTVAALEPDGEEHPRNSSGLVNAELPPGMRSFNLGALAMAPVWTLIYRSPALCVLLWICVAAIGWTSYQSTYNPFSDKWLVFRLDAISHAALWVLSIVAGVTGGRTAWRGRRFDSPERFRRCMLLWQIAGALALLIFAAAFCAFLVMTIRHNFVVE